MDNHLSNQLRNVLARIKGLVRMEQFHHMTWIHVKTEDKKCINCFVYEDGRGKCFTQIPREELSDRVKDNRTTLRAFMNNFSRKHDVSVRFDSDGNVEIEKIWVLNNDSHRALFNGDEALNEMIMDTFFLRNVFLAEA